MTKKQNREVMKRLGIGMLMLVAVCVQAAPKLNVIVLMVDDMGWKDVGFNGNDFVETPNIDKLASRGLVFSHGYASGSLCSPTRAAFQTGKTPATLGVNVPVTQGGKGNTPGEYPKGDGAKNSKLRLLPPFSQTCIAEEEVTLADTLKAAGYKTGFLGKWHLGFKGTPESDPTNYGYDVNVGGGAYHGPPSWFSPYRNTAIEDGPKGEHLTERLTNEAIAFMEAHTRSTRSGQEAEPFFLYFPYYQVHTPHDAAQAYIEKFEAKNEAVENSKMNSIYSAMMLHLDDSVGRICDYLKESGLDENTLLIFTSDNGALVYQRARGQKVPAETQLTYVDPLRGWKGAIYEGGIRVPYIFSLPGTIEPGVSDVPIITHDLYPTICDMVGVQVPAKQKLEGESIVPLLTASGDIKPRSLYWHNPKYSWSRKADIIWADRPASAIQKDNYKLIYYYEPGNRYSLELYDLENDLSESNNLAKQMPEKADALKDELLVWLDETQAMKPIDNPHYDPKHDHMYVSKKDKNK